ncbi:MAG: prephenate dehydratase [Gammaproteobacteria bacterium]|nr:prephenate dehydratase [Gammaproteobacteria bacterium]
MSDSKGDAESTLAGLRAEIDGVDQAIQDLLNKRARLAKAIAGAKFANGEIADFYRPEREAAVLQKVIERNEGPLPDEEMARLFREIMSACLAFQRPLRIAYLGPAGTFTQAAALKHFGHSVSTVALDTIDQVFREVEAEEAHYGVVPVENSTEGVVTHTLDSFLSSPLKICGEVSVRIHHYLWSMDGRQEDISVIYSHQQSLAQCRRWLDDNLPNVVRMGVGSNADAARRAAAEPGAAAVAGEVAGEIYGLRAVAANIEDEPNNTTRFLVVGNREVSPTGNDKTTVILSTVNRAGALATLLQPLSRQNVSMTRIESRPSRRAIWDYVFFIDLMGHQHDANLHAALDEIGGQASFLKVLGSYPRAVM